MADPSRHATPIRSAHRDGRGAVIIAALFAPLVLLLLVAGMTWRSERRVAAVTDRVVHDYAAIAVWQYARRANMVLHDEVMEAFSGPIAPGHQRMNVPMQLEPPSTLLAHHGDGSSSFHEGVRFAFNYDPATDRLDTAGDTVGTRTIAMVRRRLAMEMRATRANEEPHRVLFDSADGRSYAVALWVISAEGASPIVRGIASDAHTLRATFARVLADPNLIPAVRGTVRDRSGALALRLSRRDGAVVFATDHPLGATAASDTAGLQGGELRASLDLTPELAQELLIGGTPGSQLPSLGLLIAAAAVLAVVGLIQHRRGRALAQVRTRFVANVSHELRTPLAQISMFAETLALGRERNDVERKQFAHIVFAEARRLTALVENVLRFSRAEHAEPALRLEPHRVAELVAGAANAFSPLAAAAGVRIEVEIPDSIRARVDAAAFQQVMLNLLDNAVKHGQGQRVRVAAAAEGDEVRVMVDDAGPGIPVEWRTRVFEPFAQVAGRNITGAGIGLAIVHDLVVAHGGSVWIEDSPLGGARVILALPRDASASLEASPPEVRPAMA